MEDRLRQLSPERRTLLMANLRSEGKDHFKEPGLLKRREDAQFYPLSFAQERLWFLHQLEPSSPFYNEHYATRMLGHLKVQAFEQSLQEVIRRHEILRTTFHFIDGLPVQQIHQRSSFKLTFIDLSMLPPFLCEEMAQQYITQEPQQLFSFENGPLLRVGLLRLAREKHILAITVHHIISDHWSISLFFRELSLLYGAFCNQQLSPLSDLLIQYADFALWQRGWLTEPTLKSLVSYWQEQLAGAPTVIELPGDYPRPANQAFRGAQLSLLLPEKLIYDLKGFSRQEGVTLFMTMVAAFQVLLYRYTEQDDLLIGTPAAGRPLPETEQLIGFFLNMLILRSRFSPKLSFRQLLQQVRESIVGALAHPDLPFSLLVENLQPVRDWRRNPLFQIMLSFQNIHMAPLELSGLTLQTLDVDIGITKFDLDLYLEEVEHQMLALLTYNTDLFKRETMQRLLVHFQQLLESIVAHPEWQLIDLPLLSSAERQSLLFHRNATNKKVLSDQQGVCEFIYEYARLTPHAIAVAEHSQQYTYEELDKRINQLAHYLQQRGVGPEVRVGVYLPRTFQLIVGLLAILKAGGAYVPLDLAYPQERIRFMLEDAEVSLLLTQQSLLASLVKIGSCSTFCLDTNWLLNEAYSSSPPTRAAHPVNLAYVLYTSGSTGTPKGVGITHKSLIAFMNWTRSAFTSSELAGVFASTSICFDLSVFELFAPLCSGGKVILADSVLQLLTHPLADLVTLINTVPSGLEGILLQGSLPHSVQTINLAGEVLPVRLIQQVHRQASIKRICNLYGPTEDTVYSTMAIVGEEVGFYSIGRPITNTQLYILDDHLQPVPIGISGEIYLSGIGLARGYLRQSDMTAEHFLPHPYSDLPGDRLYRTGDRARYAPDGIIEYLGRRDRQIKLHGYRIELGEIEAVLLHYPGTLTCTVEKHHGDDDHIRLIAYMVMINQENVPSTNQVRRFLSERLPGYMIPTQVIVLETLPRTERGKLKRAALPLSSSVEETRAYITPRNTLETQLQHIWESVLAHQPISVEDDFFDLGGYSILAITLTAQIERQLGYKFNIAAILECTTIASMANFLSQQKEK